MNTIAGDSTKGTQNFGRGDLHGHDPLTGDPIFTDPSTEPRTDPDADGSGSDDGPVRLNSGTGPGTIDPVSPDLGTESGPLVWDPNVVDPYANSNAGFSENHEGINEQGDAGFGGPSEPGFD